MRFPAKHKTAAEEQTVPDKQISEGAVTQIEAVQTLQSLHAFLGGGEGWVRMH